MTRARKSRGFLLIELLIALGISAAILTCVYGMLYAAAKSWRALHERGRLYRAGRTLLNRMERDLSSSIPLKSLPFRGTARSMVWAAALADPERGVPVPARVEYSALTDAAGGGRPERRATHLTQNDGPPAEAAPAEIRDYSFAYAHRAAAGGRWMDEWRFADRLPEAVRVRLQLRSGSGREALELEKTVRIFHGRFETP